MLNACSTTIGLIAIGVSISNTIIRSPRSSDNSMTVFVADSIQNFAGIISLAYSVYRLFGVNPSKEKVYYSLKDMESTHHGFKVEILWVNMVWRQAH